jgi:hypothetical protein
MIFKCQDCGNLKIWLKKHVCSEQYVVRRPGAVLGCEVRADSPNDAALYAAKSSFGEGPLDVRDAGGETFFFEAFEEESLARFTICTRV